MPTLGRRTRVATPLDQRQIWALACLKGWSILVSHTNNVSLKQISSWAKLTESIRLMFLSTFVRKRGECLRPIGESSVQKFIIEWFFLSRKSSFVKESIWFIAARLNTTCASKSTKLQQLVHHQVVLRSRRLALALGACMWCKEMITVFDRYSGTQLGLVWIKKKYPVGLFLQQFTHTPQ